MIGEVISVGTELLIGEIVNTNAATIATRLTSEGFDAHHQVTVGDNLGRLVDAITAACSRADVVILTGGIGPTQDDLTKEALCVATGVVMERDEQYAAIIYEQVRNRRGTALDSILRMADIPRGATPLPNGNGLALGVALHHRGTAVFSLPGVPREMNLMLDEQVVPRLRDLTKGETVQSTIVRTRGLGESEVAHKLDSLFTSANPTIAFRITDDEVLVRITAKASSIAVAEVMLRDMRANVHALLGSNVVT